MFETAVDSIVALKIVGIDTLQAQKFVRLCLADTKGAMQLSKNKRSTIAHSPPPLFQHYSYLLRCRKVAAKLGKCGLLPDSALDNMQKCVDESYADILKMLNMPME
jgi:hypothetical protein